MNLLTVLHWILIFDFVSCSKSLRVYILVVYGYVTDANS